VPYDPGGMKTFLAFARAFQSMDRFARKAMRELGLCFTDFVLLEALLSTGPHTPGELVERIGITSGSVTAALDRMERKGLVARADSATDRRSRVVTLTSAGADLIGPAYAAHAAEIDRVMGVALSTDDRRRLFEMSRALQRAADKELS
jgi:MarR family transcriptional regulator, 2-MHQ and catechol-resistance regulon repressor